MDEPLLPLLALLDSGAECDSLDHQHFVQTGVKLELLEDLITALALNGSLLAKVAHKTCPVTLILSRNHH